MKQHVRLMVLGIALLAGAASAPLEAANKEHLQMMAELRILQQQTQSLQKQLMALTDALTKVSADLKDQTNADRKAFADQKLVVGGVATDLRVIREKVDESNVRLTSLSQEVEAIRVAQAAIPPAATPAQPLDPGAAAQEAPAATNPAGQAPVPNPGVSPQRLFESARADYYAGQWSLAIQGFETYIKTFPKSDLADDAQYYIGETYYSSGRFREAVAAYDRVISNYPSSNTLPDTYYKRGLAHNSLGQVPQARESFEFVVKNYPDSDAGHLAKQALDRLSRSGK
ncbi:MAG: tol-pal system protein YbgF [Acidobacteria bacterium]|nr:tol-pal system protein YbgF [Acidobacteriota bacterium]